MRVYVIGKKGFCVMVAAVLVLGCLGFFGLRQVAVSVNSAPKQLPIYSVALPEDDKRVSYGINCAWGNGDIPQILDTLDKYQVKATFFLVGDWCEKYPESVQEIDRRGHEIGNHSDTHPDMPSLTADKMKQEIEGCSQKIEQLTKKKVTLFRPPSGAYNNTVIQTVNELGYYPVQWDCDSLDWKGYTTKQMKERIYKTLRPGSIMLFHNDTKYTAQALPEIIAAMQGDGYQIVPVGEMIYPDNYTIDPAGRQTLNS